MKIKYTLKTKLQKIQKENLEYVLKFDKDLSNINISEQGKTVIITFNTKSNQESKELEILKLLHQIDLPIEIKNKTLFVNTNKYAKEKNANFFDELLSKKIIYKEMDGVYIYFGIMNKLYIALNNLFRKQCLKLGAEEVYIPSLLNEETLRKTNYLINNGKLCNFVVHKGTQYEIDGILNPAACQPIYKTFGNIDGEKIITGFSRVYRFEGGNYKELSRLREYGIRELIVVSDEKGILRFRKKCIKLAKDLLIKLNLSGCIEVASDMFFEGDFMSKALYQIANENKLEIKLQLSKNESVAGGSLNIHNNFFANSWRICYNKKVASSFCMGLGIERWCYAILCQYGCDESLWPQSLRSLINYYAR